MAKEKTKGKKNKDEARFPSVQKRREYDTSVSRSNASTNEARNLETIDEKAKTIDLFENIGGAKMQRNHVSGRTWHISPFFQSVHV